ncbi:3-deoxy-D-manno-octulosonic acid transferase [Geomonas sp.]|uniref:3-deoxy-D-manno-octulosonic acid transferase n=1 Tax=Geomonas sp. TaxID=2651584 RepID=UPI002B4926FF|nr:3-deoxy-D-manno-octulosonic acid transferase [Geomonas sp.]HJV35505.1 3-deoxy-D-manno-octulosonic acid transferase [Geomonas sp.]
MFFVFYNIFASLLILPVTLFHLYQKLKGSNPPTLSERLGGIPAEQLKKIGGRPVIWVHAVSVGETLAARPLLAALKERYPGHALLLSNSTLTGREVSGRLPVVDANICFPFDFLPAVRRALDTVRPQVIVIMETEVWPNFTREADRRGIPVLLANGRISDRSFGRYLKFSWVFRPALQLFSALGMQTALDAERIVAIGARQDRTQALGNLKCDIAYRQVSEEEKAELRGRYTIPAELSVLTAGSTRPGEEEYVLEAYRELLAERPDLFLVVVPRHPERAAEVASILERKGLPYRRRTELQKSASSFAGGEVLLVDTVGELMNLYALSDLVFVGGSLVPTGGHNLLEPASLGVPSLFGPHMNNFREITALVLRYHAGIQLKKPEELAPRFRDLLGDADKRHQLGQNALTMMRENGGATEKHMKIVERYLG